MSAPVTTSPEAIEAIERLYEFREPEEVRAFLAENPDLIDLLVEAAETIPTFLPPDGRIILDVLWDRDEVDDDELFALVPTRLEPEDVRPMMDRLDRAWVIDAFRRSGGRFNVGVEYY